MNTKSTGVISLLLVGIFFGISGPIAKYLSTWVNPYQAVAIRFGVAFLLAFIISLFSKLPKAKTKVNITDIAVFSIVFPISVVFFTLAVFNTKVSLAIFSFYIANLVSSFVLGKMFLKEEINRTKLISLILIVIALSLFTNIFTGFIVDKGFVFGLISGVLQTITSISQKKLGGLDRLNLVKIQTLTGLVFAIIFMGVTGTLSIPTLTTSALIVGFAYGLLFLIISYLLLVGFQKVDINIGSMLVSTELFFGPLFAYLIFKETLSFTEVIGSILVILAVVNLNLKKSII